MPTMTLNLSEQEMAVLDKMAAEKGLTKTQVMKNAIRTYQFVDAKLTAGNRIFFESDKACRIELALP